MASTAVDASLQAALDEFQDVLTPVEKDRLHTLSQVPDHTAVITFTAQVDQENASRRGRCVSNRLFGVLESVQQFSLVVDTFVSAHPGVAAPVWGGLKLSILTATNVSSYFDKFSEYFMAVGKHCPRYSEYQSLFPNSVGLQTALCNFYATIIRFCKRAIEVFRRTGLQQFVTAFWKPFEIEFSSFTRALGNQRKELKAEISLAAEQAASQERQLQDSHRQHTGLFSRKFDKESAENREWRLQAEERKSKKKKERLLAKLSTYDFLTALKHERKKRHGKTSSWLSQTSEWNKWVHGPSSSVFWCSGILGSGKTVLVAKVIDDLFCLRSPGDTVSFFFCRYDEPQSLHARTIISCLIRQCLQAETLTRDVETQLTKLFEIGKPDIEELGALLETVISASKTHFIVIDALDESARADLDTVLTVLHRVFDASRSTVKIFIASREGISIDLKKHFPTSHHRMMSTPEVHADIETYVKDVIWEKKDNGDLAIGTPQLTKDVCDALVEGAQGMFLYVVFQLNDICEQTCDEDIREVITHLPKDLPETFERVLSRISRSGQGKAKMAEKVFRWVSTARRPLHLEELHEAIGIEPCQSSLNPEKLVTKVDQIVPFCGGFVTLEEEDGVVQFAHHSVKQFLLSASRSDSSNFRFQLSQADHEAGEICVTYLNFSDFKRQVAERPKPRSPQPSVEPKAIIKATLSTIQGSKGSTVSNSWSKLERLCYSRRESKFDTMGHLLHVADGNDAATLQKLGFRCAFLAYASEYWLSHTADFDESNTPTWSLWKHILITSDPLAQVPWTVDDWTGCTRTLSQYIVENNHYALLRMIGNSKLYTFSQTESYYLLSRALRLGHIRLFDLLLESLPKLGGVLKNILTPDLFEAAANGQSEWVQRLLKAGVRATAMYTGSTWSDAAALDIIICNGSDAMIRTMLRTRSGFKTQSSERRRGLLSPLHLAAMFGHQSVIRILLEHGSEIEARTQHEQQTALHLAARQGYASAVQELLTYGADVEAKNVGRLTALHIAAQFGHLFVVNLLLNDGADIMEESIDGKQALHYAAQFGRESVVHALLMRGAAVDAHEKQHGITPLHFAASLGLGSLSELVRKSPGDPTVHVKDTTLQKLAIEKEYNSEARPYESVIRLLLNNGADVDAKDSHGYTALHFAAGWGLKVVVQLLLDRNADINQKQFRGETALDVAKKRGYYKIIKLLEGHKSAQILVNRH